MAPSFSGELWDRTARLAQSQDFENYRAARDWVLRLKDGGQSANGPTGGAATPSRYWQEEVAGFDYMFDATPLIVAKLRHHCYHITGLKVYDYRTGKGAAKQQFAQKIEALNELGHPELLVPESPRLGGFGHEIGGALYNIDTLKFYEAMVALQHGGVLGAFAEAGERRIVWEIGAGWGGFAYTFKTLFPNVTYVIVDLPETMLFSATYLRCLFPQAAFHFHEPGGVPAAADWAGKDFVFLPHDAVDALRPPRLDLTVNMVSFQEMTTEQVRGYVAKAADLGSRFVYSLNRNRSPYNAELTSVADLLAERFWTREIPVLPVSYTKMLTAEQLDSLAAVRRRAGRDGPRKTIFEGLAAADRGSNYRNIVGWPRIAA